VAEWPWLSQSLDRRIESPLPPTPGLRQIRTFTERMVMYLDHTVGGKRQSRRCALADAKKRGYPRITRGWSNAPVAVAAEDWVSQPDAAQTLGVPVLFVGWLIACEHLEPAEGPQGPGVIRSSLDREVAWRKEATWRDRLVRLVKNVVRWV
jgi:hypothetical protein